MIRDLNYVFTYYGFSSKKVGFRNINLDNVTIIWVDPYFKLRVKNKRHKRGYWESGFVLWHTPLDFYARLEPKVSYEKQCKKKQLALS